MSACAVPWLPSGSDSASWWEWAFCYLGHRPSLAYLQSEHPSSTGRIEWERAHAPPSAVKTHPLHNLFVVIQMGCTATYFLLQIFRFVCFLLMWITHRVKTTLPWNHSMHKVINGWQQSLNGEVNCRAYLPGLFNRSWLFVPWHLLMMHRFEAEWHILALTLQMF